MNEEWAAQVRASWAPHLLFIRSLGIEESVKPQKSGKPFLLTPSSLLFTPNPTLSPQRQARAGLTWLLELHASSIAWTKDREQVEA